MEDGQWNSINVILIVLDFWNIFFLVWKNLVTVKAEYKNCSTGLRDLFVNINGKSFLFILQTIGQRGKIEIGIPIELNIILIIFIQDYNLVILNLNCTFYYR